MSSIGLPREETRRSIKREPVAAFYSGLALTALWAINLLIVLFGWPFLLYGIFKYRKPQPESKLVALIGTAIFAFMG